MSAERRPPPTAARRLFDPASAVGQPAAAKHAPAQPPPPHAKAKAAPKAKPPFEPRIEPRAAGSGHGATPAAPPAPTPASSNAAAVHRLVAAADAPTLDALPPALLSDAPACFIVGVIGRKRVGKSSILNLLAARTASPPFNSKLPTRGIDLHATGDGLILLDAQAIPLPKKQGSSHRKNASEDTASLTRAAEKMTLFLFSVCHVILVVSSGSSTRDDEMWAFLRRMEAVKYRADGGTGPVLDGRDSSDAWFSGKQKRQRRRKRNGHQSGKMSQPLETNRNESDDEATNDRSDDNVDGDDDDDEDENEGDDVEDPQNETEARDHQQSFGHKAGKQSRQQSSIQSSAAANNIQPLNPPTDPDIFFPDLIFVHNRAKPSDFAQNNYASTCSSIRRAFRGSRLKAFSNILNFSQAFPTLYPSIATSHADSLPNVWLIPPFPTYSTLLELPSGTTQSAQSDRNNQSTATSLLDKLSDITNLKAVLRDSDGIPARHQVLCEMLRDSILEIPRYPFELPPPLSTVFKSFESDSSTVVSAGGGGGKMEGGTGVNQTVPPLLRRKWFQVSEREWYNSAVGIWKSLE
ncbi:hypothetical protein BDR26DRAFT_893291 [Obelidium mucronatum]|nr:hypothetical protein BDR26DRAFT_893291 [Obelidium mucronatum]